VVTVAGGTVPAPQAMSIFAMSGMASGASVRPWVLPEPPGQVLQPWLQPVQTVSMAEPVVPVVMCAGDLFAVAHEPDAWCLAHCVSADLSMSQGIAVSFVQQFGGRAALACQDRPIGATLVLRNRHRVGSFVFALVTKSVAPAKPSLASLESAVRTWRDWMLSLRVHRCAFPRLACGLDGLEWPVVCAIIARVFAECPSVPAWQLRCYTR
jgi:O-acetyl-ADP-ribose deacetylase (regulator of RNase III)